MRRLTSGKMEAPILMTKRHSRSSHDASKRHISRPISNLVIACRTCIWAILTILLATYSIIRISPLVHRQGPVIGHEGFPAACMPIPCHSHNDYWRRVPLLSALEAGCVGVEVDVWPYQDDLYVAHTRGSMRPGLTLKNTYLEPLRLLLQDGNCATPDSGCSSDGLYEASPLQTVVLLIDIKADAHTALHILAEQLEPLRQRGWLSTVRDGHMKTGPITVVVSGHVLHASRALEMACTSSQDMFFDAPLMGLENGRYNRNNSYWASASLSKSVWTGWFGSFGPRQLEQVRRQMGVAHSLGLKARYWGLPCWPTAFREDVWRFMLDAGLDVINIDDVQGFARFWERYENVLASRA